jgi:hypothetical protein
VAPVDRSPTYVAAFLSLLGLAQAGALVAQVVRGYRPFIHAPDRVVLSWDMFSTAISRCDVRWDPPLDVGGRPVARLHDTGLPIEWDPVYDHVADYQATAAIGCTRAARGTTVTLLCFTSDGETVHDAFHCR